MKKFFDIIFETVSPEIYVFVGLYWFGCFYRFPWSIIFGMISCLVIYYAKQLIPEKKVLTSAELAAFRILQQEIKDLQVNVSQLNVRLGFKKSEKQ